TYMAITRRAEGGNAMRTQGTPSRLPRTQAVRRALRSDNRPEAVADLLFIESWELHAAPDLADLLRAGQIRRANPDLVAEIEAELKAH
ncbi:MAG: hypothetical protein KGL35_20115, partial [Bradyrhizobium sp.]|nr:hypothetical protein [Bradyrhizobium sp.]